MHNDYPLAPEKISIPYEILSDYCKKVAGEKLPDKRCFHSCSIDGKTNDNGEKLDGHISDEDHLTCNKICNKFNMKNMANYHNHYLKQNVLLLIYYFIILKGFLIRAYNFTDLILIIWNKI